jgi:uncharacterized protein YndB with AHSA1/START domain
MKDLLMKIWGCSLVAAFVVSIGLHPISGASNTVSRPEQNLKTRDLVVTRVFNAPAERVWKAWSDPEYVMRWWGPKVFTSPIAKIDFRVGGTSLVCMRSPDGHDMYNSWTYRKIVPGEMIEFVLDWADKDGNRIDPAQMGLPPDMPRDVRHVITFKAVDKEKTEMTVTEFGYKSDQHLELSKAGLNECLDKMAAIFDGLN